MLKRIRKAILNWIIKCMEKVYWSIEKLQIWDKNLRSISKPGFERLKKQIELGEYKPLIITRDGVVLGGNMRLKAYQELGTTAVWVSVIDFVKSEDGWHGVIDGKQSKKSFKTKEDAMFAYNLSDNDQAGYYDEDLFANMLPELGIDPTEFAVSFVEPVTLRELNDRYADDKEDDAPEVDLKSKPVSKRGEIYLLGRHRLMCGDATSCEDMQKLMGDATADMVFTDPPYNVNYEGSMNTHDKNEREGMLNDNLTDEQFYRFLRDSVGNMMQACRGVFYICMASKELPNLKKAFEDAGGHWQSYVIWVKNNFTLSRSDYQNQYEPILYGWNKNITNHYFVDDRTQGNVWEDVGKRAVFDGKYTEMTLGGLKVRLEGKVTGQILKGKRKLDIWRYDKPSKSEEHPTMKPVLLVSEAIRNSTILEQNVLDPFGGSGTTLIACEQSNRNCLMMELDPKYVDVIRKRYAKLIGEEEKWQEVTTKL